MALIMTLIVRYTALRCAASWEGHDIHDIGTFLPRTGGAQRGKGPFSVGSSTHPRA